MEEPGFITTADWANIFSMQVSLWLFTGAMVMFAFSLMLGHAIIPSLIDTRHIAARAASLRPLAYGLAVLFFVIAMGIFINMFTAYSGSIYGFYSNAWT